MFYTITMTIIFLGLLFAVFMTAYNIYMNHKEQVKFDIEYRKEQERKGK